MIVGGREVRGIGGVKLSIPGGLNWGCCGKSFRSGVGGFEWLDLHLQLSMRMHLRS